MTLPVAFALVACQGEGSPGFGTGDAQTPPTTSAQAITDWVAGGAYQSWHCEPAPHAPRDPSPHGDADRICSNDLLSAAGTGPYPIGAANVKELFTGGRLAGYAVYVKDRAGEGDAFVWYEAIDGEVGAFGHGDSGKPKSSCVGCHVAAGPDHFGHDYVFTQVR